MLTTETVHEKSYAAGGAKTRKEAIDRMSFSPAKVVKVCGGWMGFRAITDYKTWKNQK